MMINSLTTVLLAVTLVQNGDKWSVKNDHYELTYDASKNGVLTSAKYSNARFNLVGKITCAFDGQQKEYNNRTHEEQRKCVQAVAGGSAKVVANDGKSVIFEFGWPLDDGGKVVEKVSFDDSPVVKYAVDVEWNQTMGDISFGMYCPQARNDATLFYPEARHFKGPYVNGERSMLPRWRLLECGNINFGIAAGEGSDWQYMKYAVNFFSGYMELHSRYQADEPAPGKKHLDFSLVFTKDRALGCHFARKAAGAAPKVQLTNITPDKVFNRRGERNGMTVTIVNNEQKDKDVKVVVELASGLNEVRKISEETLTLKPEQCRVYKKDWSYDADFEWGVATRVTLFDATTGEKLDYRADITTVNNRAIEAAGVGIVNAGQAYKDGDEAYFASGFARNYFGMVEYYCWSPSTWDPTRRLGMAPSIDSWRPVTEANYKGPVTKTFVKGLVNECHKRGVDVYSWITGLCNAQLAYAYPEMFQHCPDGQPCIYNGSIDKDGTRRMTAKMAPYTVEQAKAWGEEMADSCDMFGFDGCRWDWGWIPAAPNDPRYHDELLKNPKLLEWFDWKGRSAFELYKQPDETAYQCLKAWRETVLKRHPNFVDGANVHCSPEMMKQNPKYMDYRCRDCLGLNEYLLNVAGQYPKAQQWGFLIAQDVQTLRTRGSQCMVGFMRGFNDESDALLLTRSICHAAGCKWWGGGGDVRYWGAKARSLPFSMRFGEWFFALDLLQVPKDERASKVFVKDDAKLYWNDFVYERKLKDGRRELVVHVVNINPDDYNMPKKTIVPRKVTMKPMLAGGEKSVEAWALVPGDEPQAIALYSQNGEYTLERMEEAAAFIFRFAK